MKRRTLLTYLALSAATAAVGRVTPALAQERVGVMCGHGPVPWESLCNVEPELHDAFRWIERIGGGEDFFLRDRLSAMIRDRHAAIDWHPNGDLPIIHPGLLGLYDPSTGRVYVPQALKGQPERVKATILAHELAHAIWQVDEMGAGLDAVRGCLANEALAYNVGLLLYARVFGLSGEGDYPESAVDQLIMGDAAELGRLLNERGADEAFRLAATRHLVRSGRRSRCARDGG